MKKVFPCVESSINLATESRRRGENDIADGGRVVLSGCEEPYRDHATKFQAYLSLVVSTACAQPPSRFDILSASSYATL